MSEVFDPISELKSLLIMHGLGFLAAKVAVAWARKVLVVEVPLAVCSPLVALARTLVDSEEEQIGKLLEAAGAQILPEFDRWGPGADTVVHELFSHEVAAYLDGQITPHTFSLIVEGFGISYPDRWWLKALVSVCMKPPSRLGPNTQVQDVPWLAQACQTYLDHNKTDFHNEAVFSEPAHKGQDLMLEILDAQPQIEGLPQLGLEEYSALITPLTMPTNEQIKAFVDFVCRAKSWYKHLPDFVPGEEFYFYLDPQAGKDRMLNLEGCAYFASRVEGSVRFHHSWCTTEEYRRRFGYLTFACGAVTELYTMVDFNPTGLTGDEGTFVLDNNWARMLIWKESGEPCVLPFDVLNIGSAKLTRAIHPSLPDRLAEREKMRGEMVAAIKRLRALLLPQVHDQRNGKVGLFREGKTFYLARARCDHLQDEYVKVTIEPLDRAIPQHVTPSDSLFRNDNDTLWEGVYGRWIIYFDPCLVAAALRVMNTPYFDRDPSARMLAFTSLMLAATSDEWQKKQSATRPLFTPAGVALTDQQNLEVSIALELGREGRKLRCAEDNLEVAILILRAALDLGGPVLGDVQDIAVFRNDLGLLLRANGEYKEAVNWFAAAHEYFARHQAISHPDFTTTLHNLGATQMLIGLEQEGEAALRQALSLHEEFQTTSKLDWSNTCWLLASANSAKGDQIQSNGLSGSDEAIALLEKAMELRYDFGHDFSEEMGKIAFELACLLRDSQANYQAERAFERALKCYESARGPNDAETLSVLNEMLLFLNSVGRREQAAALKQRYHGNTRA